MSGFTRGERAQHKDATMQAIDRIMTGIAGNPIALMEVVAGGAYTFRLRFLRELRGFAVNEHVADLVFKFFCERVVQRFGQSALADPAQIAGEYLDSVEIRTPPTEQEIEDSWVHEVWSSDDGRRQFYKDGAGMAGDSKVIIH